MLFSKAKTDFLEYMEIEQNRSQKTIENYDHYLTRLIDFAGDIKVGDIDAEMIRKWRLWLNRLGTNTSDELGKITQNYHLIALRSFLKFCAKRDIPALAADKVELARTGRKQVTFLNEDELKRIFASRTFRTRWAACATGPYWNCCLAPACASASWWGWTATTST